VSEPQLGVQISFDHLSAGEAGRAAAELRALVLDEADGIEASLRRTAADSQSVGETLVLLFGSSAAVAIAEGIRAYLAKRPGQRDGLTIRTADGEVIATGEAASKLDAPALVRALKAKPPKP
jgi:hypothetical protein